MRGYKTLIQEAELMAMPSEAVANFMKLRADQSRDEARNDLVDEEVERALIGRHDPLIDLALARYGRHLEVASEIFQAAPPNSPIRLACLSNKALGHEFFSSFPQGLLGSDPGSMATWLASASHDEIVALFENPTLGDSFLRGLLERDKVWASIDDDMLCNFVRILQRNPRMRTPRKDDFMDGYADYSYGSVFNAAWTLAGTVPANDAWAFSLGWLYEQLHPEAFSIKDPLALAARWHASPDDVKQIEEQAKNHSLGHLGNMERVRKGLARLALSKDSTLLEYLLFSDDIAFRAAAYSAGKLTADQLRAGYEKDGNLVLIEALHNMNLWRTQGARQALRDVAWEVVDDDPHSDLMGANLFNSMETDIRKQHPRWFDDEAEGFEPSHDDIDSQEPNAKVGLVTLAAHMERQSRDLNALGKSLGGLMNRAGWIWWFSLGALLASLRHF